MTFSTIEMEEKKQLETSTRTSVDDNGGGYFYLNAVMPRVDHFPVVLRHPNRTQSRGSLE